MQSPNHRMQKEWLSECDGHISQAIPQHSSCTVPHRVLSRCHCLFHVLFFIKEDINKKSKINSLVPAVHFRACSLYKGNPSTQSFASVYQQPHPLKQHIKQATYQPNCWKKASRSWNALLFAPVLLMLTTCGIWTQFQSHFTPWSVSFTSLSAKVHINLMYFTLYAIS